MLESLHRRQLGLHAFSTTCAAGVHQAKSFEGKLTADVGLLRRLACSAELDAHTGAVSSLAWNEDGLLLLSGGEDNKVRLWEPSLSRERACFALVSVSLSATSSRAELSETSLFVPFIRPSRPSEYSRTLHSFLSLLLDKR